MLDRILFHSTLLFSLYEINAIEILYFILNFQGMSLTIDCSFYMH